MCYKNKPLKSLRYLCFNYRTTVRGQGGGEREEEVSQLEVCEKRFLSLKKLKIETYGINYVTKKQ